MGISAPAHTAQGGGGDIPTTNNNPLGFLWWYPLALHNLSSLFLAAHTRHDEFGAKPDQCDQGWSRPSHGLFLGSTHTWRIPDLIEKDAFQVKTCFFRRTPIGAYPQPALIMEAFPLAVPPCTA